MSGRNTRRSSLRRRRRTVLAMHLRNASVCHDNHSSTACRSREETNPLWTTHLRCRVLCNVRPAHVHARSTRVCTYRSRRCGDLRMRWSRRLRHGKVLLSRSWKNRHRRGMRATPRMYRHVSTSAFRKKHQRKKNLSRQHRLRRLGNLRPHRRLDRHFDLQQIARDKLTNKVNALDVPRAIGRSFQETNSRRAPSPSTVLRAKSPALTAHQRFRRWPTPKAQVGQSSRLEPPRPAL